MNDHDYRKVGDKPIVPLDVMFRNFAHNLPIWLLPAFYPDGVTPRARNDNPKTRKKTKRGAVHQHKPTFRSVNLLDVSPAEYRRRHMGAR